ncbi:MAG: hypothetical protein JOZ24_06805 [Candidatus Eremiobacteraeota bacterium]|nr:hypothetical protein [Candidatus Eremiobacteraeota bacterium]
MRSAEEIETALVEIDAFAAPREVKPTWQAIDAVDHWRLELPPTRVALDRRGRPIAEFATKWDQWVTEARRIAPHEDAERFANRMLNVDAKTVRYERRRIDVKRDGDKYVTLYSTEDLPERVIEVSSSLPGALGSAYQRVDEMLSGYTAIPVKPAAAPRPNGPAVAEKHGGGRRRRRGRPPHHSR